jgi:hypothetical protein
MAHGQLRRCGIAPEETEKPDHGAALATQAKTVVMVSRLREARLRTFSKQQPFPQNAGLTPAFPYD